MIVGSNILAGASGQQGYFLNRSVRFRSSASAYFSRTLASTTNRKTFTQSIWLKRGTLGVDQYPIFAFNGGNTLSYYLNFDSLNRLSIASNIEGVSNNFNLLTTQVFRDPSAWYHIVVAMDTTQATASNRLNIYVNGVQVTAFTTATYPSLNFDNAWNNSSIANTIGRNSTATFDGYLAEINVIDGQALTPTSFGEFNTLTGVWQPKKYVGTYGTNGFYLNFNDNSAATAAAIGKDSSGNGNNWTPNNISVTAGVTYDSMTDVPTLTSPTTSNYCVLNTLNKNASNITVLNGNLSISTTASNVGVAGTFGVLSGKWYWETTFTNASGVPSIGAAPSTWDKTYVGSPSGGGIGYHGNGVIYNNGTNVQSGLATYTSNDVISVALDLDAGSIKFYKNNVQQGTTITGITGEWFPAIAGQTSSTLSSNFGQQPFSYTPPTGFVALNTYNLPTPTISNGATQFAATIYTGTNTTQSISNAVNGKSFQPDFVWFKSRSAAYAHALFDSVRGVTKGLDSQAATAEQTSTAGNDLSAFTSSGFTVGAPQNWNSPNNSSSNPVSWQWKSSNDAAVTNTAGSISSQISANTTSGFSVVTYSGNGSNPATVGHGIGIAPKFIILKRRNSAVNWFVYANAVGNGAIEGLNTTNAYNAANTTFNLTAPTSTVFSLGNADGNASGGTYVAYCFSSIAGYSEFGKYTGNGSTDGTFVFLGFRPRWLMIKRTDTAGYGWNIYDTTRSPYNAAQIFLQANSASAETNNAAYAFDLLSNGFKLRQTDALINASGGTYIYAAFAENPFKNSLAR